METYRKIQKILFTIISRGFVTPVQSLKLNSILYSLPSNHYKGLILTIQAWFETYLLLYADLNAEGLKTAHNAQMEPYLGMVFQLCQSYTKNCMRLTIKASPMLSEWPIT